MAGRVPTGVVGGRRLGGPRSDRRRRVADDGDGRANHVLIERNKYFYCARHGRHDRYSASNLDIDRLLGMLATTCIPPQLAHCLEMVALLTSY